MSNWDDIRVTLGRATNKVVNKAEELADSGSRYVRLKAKEGKLSAKFEELGTLAYKQLKLASDEAQSISRLIDEIDELKAEIKAIKLEIEQSKKQRSEQA